MKRSWPYLYSSRIHCTDCVIAGRFGAGWVYLYGFLGSGEKLQDEQGKLILEIEIPLDLRRAGNGMRFTHPKERIEFEILHEYI